MRIWKCGLAILFALVFSLFLIRLILPRQLDDVSPGIPCEKALLEKADVFYVIPEFKDVPISENRSWCNYILSLNKTLEMHGITHRYMEFGSQISSEEFERGREVFRKCFGFEPKKFKPPQLEISSENRRMVRRKMKLDGYWNQISHKVYHCSDTGVLPNRLVEIL